MAKKQRFVNINNQPQRTTPSEFGSHASMINEDAQARLVELHVADNLVILTDDYGDYVTTRDRLDSGLADPNRYDSFEIRGGSSTISKANYANRQKTVDAILSEKAA